VIASIHCGDAAPLTVGGRREHELLCVGRGVVIERIISATVPLLAAKFAPFAYSEAYIGDGRIMPDRKVGEPSPPLCRSLGVIWNNHGLRGVTLHPPCISENTNVLAPGFIPRKFGQERQLGKICSAGMKSGDTRVGITEWANWQVRKELRNEV
jgi:hypothetical protein